MLNAFFKALEPAFFVNPQFRQFIHSSGCQLDRTRHAAKRSGSSRPSRKDSFPRPKTRALFMLRTMLHGLMSWKGQLPTARRKLDDFSHASGLSRKVIMAPKTYGQQDSRTSRPRSGSSESKRKSDDFPRSSRDSRSSSRPGGASLGSGTLAQVAQTQASFLVLPGIRRGPLNFEEQVTVDGNRLQPLRL